MPEPDALSQRLTSLLERPDIHDRTPEAVRETAEALRDCALALRNDRDSARSALTRTLDMYLQTYQALARARLRISTNLENGEAGTEALIALEQEIRNDIDNLNPARALKAKGMSPYVTNG